MITFQVTDSNSSAELSCKSRYSPFVPLSVQKLPTSQLQLCWGLCIKTIRIIMIFAIENEQLTNILECSKIQVHKSEMLTVSSLPNNDSSNLFKNKFTHITITIPNLKSFSIILLSSTFAIM